MSERSFGGLHDPEVWTAVARGYDDAIAPTMRPFAATMLDLLGMIGAVGHPRLLDVAAGTGVAALEAARRGAHVVATDFAPGMVEVICQRSRAEGLDIHTEVMDGQNLDLDDESFDLATSTFGLMFFADPAAGLRELHRVLRPKGRVGIATWDLTQPGQLPQLISAAFARVVPHLPAPPPPPWSPLCEPAGLAQALREACFTEVNVHQVTHSQNLPNPADFFRHLPDWTPPLRPLFTSLSALTIDAAADAFADIIDKHLTSGGLSQVALIGIGVP